jgi:hypothetical protein
MDLGVLGYYRQMILHFSDADERRILQVIRACQHAGFASLSALQHALGFARRLSASEVRFVASARVERTSAATSLAKAAPSSEVGQHLSGTKLKC